MGFLSKSVDGTVSVSFSRNELNQVDEDLLEHTIKSFSHLVMINEKISFSDFSDRISKCYERSTKLNLCIDVLKRAARKTRFECRFKYYDVDSFEAIEKNIVIEADDWSKISGQIEDEYRATIFDLEISLPCSVFRKGCFSISPDDLKTAL